MQRNKRQSSAKVRCKRSLVTCLFKNQNESYSIIKEQRGPADKNEYRLTVIHWCTQFQLGLYPFNLKPEYSTPI